MPPDQRLRYDTDAAECASTLASRALVRYGRVWGWGTFLLMAYQTGEFLGSWVVPG
jgi:hypothetical protein